MVSYCIVFGLLYSYTLATTFHFLYNKGITFQENYEVQDIIAKVTFQQTKDIKDAYKTLTESTKDINKKFNIKKSVIGLKLNVVTRLLYELGTYSNRLKIYNNRYNKLLMSATIDPLIPETKQINITIDPTFTNTMFTAFKSSMTSISSIFNTLTSPDDLTQNQEQFKTFSTLAEIAINCIKDYLAALETHVTSAKFAHQSTLTTQLKNHLIINSKPKIDFTSIDFVTFAKDENDNLIFYIEYTELSSDIQTQELLPIAYFGYSLENKYYYDTKTTKIKKSLTTNDKKLANKRQVDNCLLALNNLNYTRAISTCQFVQNTDVFANVPQGLFFMKVNLPILSKLNTFFTTTYKEKDFPLFFQYKGAFEFSHPKYGKMTITKNSDKLITNTTLSTYDLNLLQQKIKNLINPSTRMPTLTEKMTNYLNNDFYEILLNSSFFTLTSTLILAIYKIYIRFKAYNRDPRSPQAFLLANRFAKK